MNNASFMGAIDGLRPNPRAFFLRRRRPKKDHGKADPAKAPQRAELCTERGAREYAVALQVGVEFLHHRRPYRVVFINKQKGRASISPVRGKIPAGMAEMCLGGVTYRVVSANPGRNRLTIEPVRDNVRESPGGAVCVEQSVA